MKIIVILTLSISLFSYSFTLIDAVNAGENEVGTVDYEELARPALKSVYFRDITWGGVGISIDPSAKLTLPNALAKISPEELWSTPAVLVFLLVFGFPLWAYIVLQIQAIYRTRGVWRILAILAVVPAAFSLTISAMCFAEEYNLWFLPLWSIMAIVIVYLLILNTKFIPQRQKLTFLKCPKCDNEIRNPLEKGIPKGQRLEISCPKCHFSFNID